jgi:aminoglycoside phosphotransferase
MMQQKMPLEKHPFFKDRPILSIEPVAAQGYCNLNHKVITASGVYLVRRFVNEEVDREKEYLLQQQAAAEGIAPRIELFDRKRGCMIMPFVEGTHRRKLDEEALGRLTDTIALLHHRLVYEESPLDLAHTLKSQERHIHEALDVISHYPETLAVCHNDLNPRNLIWHDDRLCLLDFEYAGVNDRYFDLAAVSVEFSLCEEAECFMLQRYFRDSWFHEKLNAYKILYRQLCKEWFAAY